MDNLDRIMTELAVLSPLIVIIFSLALYVITQKEIFLTFTVLSILLGLFLNVIEKDVFGYLFKGNSVIYRPNSKLVGFPSGHAQFWGFTFAFWTSYFLKEKNSNLFIPILLGISLYVAYSRVKIGCHTKLQVFSGFVIGLLLGYFSFKSIKMTN